jgi:hypothetical protein
MKNLIERNSSFFEVSLEYTPCLQNLPEKDLLLAILTRAILDLKQGRHIRMKALEFFLDREDDHIFSFQSICVYLEINPIQLLQRIGVKNIRYTTMSIN